MSTNLVPRLIDAVTGETIKPNMIIYHVHTINTVSEEDALRSAIISRVPNVAGGVVASLN